MLSLNTVDSEKFLNELVKRQLGWADIIYRKYEIDLKKIVKTIKSSQNLFSYDTLIKLPKESYVAIINNTVDLLKEYQPKLGDALIAFKTKSDEFCEVLMNGNETDLFTWTNNNKLPPIIISHLMDWSLRPEKMALGRVVQPLLQGEVNWESSSCPVCGEQADIATLSKGNGERQLGCSCCQVTWRYPRLKCFSCQNTNPETLKYFFVEKAPEQQIHYCGCCNSYLKTFDYRFTKENFDDLLLLNYMTAHLDLLAQKNGLGINSIN